MKLRSKIFLITGFVLSILFIGISSLLSQRLTEDFLKLEAADAKRNIERLSNTFENSKDELAIKLVDWSQWDDMYAFVDDHNQEFIDVNLVKETFTNLRINLVAVIDGENNIVFKRYINESGEEESYPEGLEEYFSADSPMVNFSSNTESRREVLSLPDGQLVVGASRPITSSDGTAPRKGSVFFGYFFNEAEANRLSHLTQTAVDFSFVDAENVDAGLEEAMREISVEKPFFVEKPQRGDEIAAYALVADVFKKPAMVLAVRMERTIFAKGQEISSLFSRIMVAVGALFLLVVLYLMETLVISPLSKLNSEVQKITSSGASASLMVYGKDEFARLRVEVNKMLGALHASEIKKREFEGRFQTIADAAPVMIWMLDTEKIMTYANKAWFDFIGRDTQQGTGYDWKRVIHQDDLVVIAPVMDKKMAAQENFSLKCRVLRADGEYRWLFFQAAPDIAPDGKIGGYFVSGVDINEVELSNAKIRAYVGEIERLNSIMVSRELKMRELKNEIEKLKQNGKK